MGNFLNDILSSIADFTNLFLEFNASLWVYPIVLFFVISTFFLIFTHNK